jgi:hypothetical protein
MSQLVTPIPAGALVVDIDGPFACISVGTSATAVVASFVCQVNELELSHWKGRPILRAAEAFVVIDDASSRLVADHVGIARA